MNSSSSDDPTPSEHVAAEHDARHPDPITGELGAHPVGVGVGAAGSGIVGAAIGAILGPIGAVVGAAIGAVAGGLAGKEIAAADDAPSVAEAADLSTETPAENEAVAPGMTGLAGTVVGAFHDHLTATTFGEAEEQDRLTGEDDAQPMEETIRTAAYFRYLDRRATGQPGDALGDWMDAEWEILQA